jgi:hypothetical protein
VARNSDRHEEPPDTEEQHEEQVAFRGLLGDVCAYEPSNRKNPELCGNEEPIVDADGKPLIAPPEAVPHSAPKK